MPTPALRGCQRSRVTPPCLPPQRPLMRTPRSSGSGVGPHGIGSTKPATGPFPDRGRGPAVPAAGGAGLCWVGIFPVDRPLRPHPTRPPLGPRQGAAAPYPRCASVMLARLRRPAGAARPRLHDRVRVLLARLAYGVHAVHTGQAWADDLRAVSRFQRYSTVAGNVWLILAQRPDASRVASFHAWRALGRHVRRGEHGIRMLAPVTMGPREDGATDDPQAAEVDHVVTRFRVATTFDIASTDGDPLPPRPLGPGHEQRTRPLAPRVPPMWRAARGSPSAKMSPALTRRTAPACPTNTPSSRHRGCPKTSAPRRCATNSGTRSWGTGRPAAGRNRRRPPRAPPSWSRPGPAWTPQPTPSAT